MKSSFKHGGPDVSMTKAGVTQKTIEGNRFGLTTYTMTSVALSYQETQFSMLQLWDRLTKEAELCVVQEPVLRGTMYRYVLDRKGLGESLSFMLADALDGFIRAEDWQPIIAEVFSGVHGLYEDHLGSAEELASADLAAIPERDPSVEDVLTPFMHFKGYKIVQAHRLAHVLWRNGRE